MSISQSFLPEFDQEMANTRKVLERLPNEKWDFKPHPKSMSVAELATHVAEMMNWTAVTVRDPGYDIPADYQPKPHPNREAALAFFDQELKAARSAIENCSDAAWQDIWKLSFGGKEMMAMPRIAVYRSFCMNHIVHHRAQLMVYLRLLDLPVPAVYGPSADEGQMMVP